MAVPAVHLDAVILLLLSPPLCGAVHFFEEEHEVLKNLWKLLENKTFVEGC
jgi:hypothetical protein